MKRKTTNKNKHVNVRDPPSPIVEVGGNSIQSVTENALERSVESQLTGNSHHQSTIPRKSRIHKSVGGVVSKQKLPPKNSIDCIEELRKRGLPTNAVAQYELSEVETILESNTIVEATRHMAAKKLDFVLVVDGNRFLKGIVTDKDLAFRVVAEKLDPQKVMVGQVMTRDPQCVQSNTSMIEALNKMVVNHFRHLPVMEEERLVGVLDIAKCLYDALQKLEIADAAANHIASALETVQAFEGVLNRTQNDILCNLREQLTCPKISSIIGENGEQSCGVVNVNCTVWQAVKMMKSQSETAVIVTEEHSNALAGIFTTKDVLLRVVAAGLDPLTTTITRVMTPYPDSTTPEEPIVTALRQMHSGHYLHLPVLSTVERNIIGVVDVLQLTYSMLEQQSQLNGKGETPLWHQLWSPPSTTVNNACTDTIMAHKEKRKDEYLENLQFPSIPTFENGSVEHDFAPLPARMMINIKYGNEVFLKTIDDVFDMPMLSVLTEEILCHFDLQTETLFFALGEEDGDLLPILDEEDFSKSVQLALTAGKDRIDLLIKVAHEHGKKNNNKYGNDSLATRLLIGAGLTGAMALVVGFIIIRSQK